MAILRMTPDRFIATLALIFLLGMAVFANDPANIPPEELKKAELTYKDTFGPAHDKATKTPKLVEKSEYAKKLFNAHQQAANDPPFQEVLRKYALQFAQLTDPQGLSVAMDVYKVYQTFPSRRGMAAEKIAGLQERGLATEPVATRAKLLADVVKGYRDAAVEYEKLGNATAATAAIGKARAVIRKYTPGDRETLAALDVEERRVQVGAAEQAETERFKSFVAKNPDDVKSKVALATRYLHYNRVREAGELFQTSGADWAAVATALNAKPLDAITTSRLMMKAQTGLPPEDKKSRYYLMLHARTVLDDFRSAQAEKWTDAVPTYAAVLELVVANEPAANAGQTVTPLVMAYIEWTEQLVGKFEYTEASNVLVRAKAVAKTAKLGSEIKEMQSEVDSAERVVKACIALDEEIAQWKTDEAKSPLDAKGNLAYGVALLRAGRNSEATKRLGLSNNPAFVALSKVLAKGDQAPPLALADALRASAAELQGNAKTDVLALARVTYEKFLETKPKESPEITRIQLLVKELPIGTRTFSLRDCVELLDENPVVYAKALAHNKPGTGGIAGEETKDVYRGKLALRGTPMSFHAPDLGFKYSISEFPKKANEFRYIGFAWKKVGGGPCELQLLGQSTYHYRAASTGKEQYYLTFRSTIPTTWSYEIRDFFLDHGSAMVTGLCLFPNDGDCLLLDAVYLSKTKASLEKYAARK